MGERRRFSGGRGAAVAAVTLVIVGGAATASAVTPETEPADLKPLGGRAADADRLFAPGEVVVRFERSADGADRRAARGSVDADSRVGLEVSRAELLELPGGTSVREAIAELGSDPAVEFAEPNYTYHLDATPDDTFFDQLWGLNNTGQTITTPSTTVTPPTFPGTADADIDAPEGWDVAPVEGGDASDVVVAVVDTGIDYTHPDLASNMWHNPDEVAGNGIDDDSNGFVDDVFGADFKAVPTSCTNAVPPACTDANPIDDSEVNHGTHVAGTVGARGDDGYGVTGVSQRVQLMAVKAFDSLDRTSNVSVGNAFDYAVDEGAQVVNASLGGPCPSGLQASVIESNPDVLFVFSAGNGGTNSVGDDNDVPDDAAAEASPAACADPANPANGFRHPGQYPCNFNAGPEAASYTGPAYDFPNVVCVAAVTNTDAKASYSNYGPTSVQLAAPGSQVLSTQPAYERMYFEGGEDPGFDGRLIDQAGIGIVDPAPAATGWQRIGSPLSGSFALSESAVGTPYPASDPNTIEPSAPIDLTGRVGCHMDWSFTIQAATNNEGLQLRVATGPSNTGPFISISQAFTGNFSTPYNRMAPAVPELNNQPQARYRINFISDGGGTNLEGSKVDDIAIRCLGGSYSPAQVGVGLIGTHKFLNGSSMATPHVAGAAALILAKAPALTPTQVIQRLMDGGDPNAALATAGATPVQSGNRLNLAGALNAGNPAVPGAPTVAGPSGTTNAATPTFNLSTDLAGSRFQCVLDGTAFGDCTTASSFTPASPLADGPHSLKVRAIGGEGGVSPTTTRDFTVDTTPDVVPDRDARAPVVTITKGPKAKVKKKKATFEFGADEAATFTCQLDGAAAAPCASPTVVKAKKGKHSFTVIATDAAGNKGQATKTWKVKKKKKRKPKR